MSFSGNMPAGDTRFEVRRSQRALRRSLLIIVLFMLLGIAQAVFASGSSRFIGLAAVLVFGLALLGGIREKLQGPRDPVMATLSHYGLTIGQSNPISWDSIREVRLEPVMAVLFPKQRQYCIAFLAAQTADLSQLSPRERWGVKMRGSYLLLRTENVTPGADDILDAVQRLSDVPVHRSARSGPSRS